jgi:hypothetical protein
MRQAQLAMITLGLALALTRSWAEDSKTTLSFDTPAEWKAEPVKGMGSQAGWKIEPVKDDPEAAHVTLYNFGGMGGTLDANVERWCGQFKQADGTAFAKDKAKIEKFEVNGLKVATVEIHGTFVGMRGNESKAGYRLIAVMVEGKGGPWFLRLLGPDKTVEKTRDAYVKWLKSARPPAAAKSE